MKKLTEQWNSKHIEQEELREFLPGLCLRISSGPDNPIANYLSMMGLSYGRLFMDMDSFSDRGIERRGLFIWIAYGQSGVGYDLSGRATRHEWNKPAEWSGKWA